jgi:hypothetical protein
MLLFGSVGSWGSRLDGFNFSGIEVEAGLLAGGFLGFAGFAGFLGGFEFFAFGADAFEEDAGGFVGGVLGDELAFEGFGEDGAIKCFIIG